MDSTGARRSNSTVANSSRSSRWSSWRQGALHFRRVRGRRQDMLAQSLGPASVRAGHSVLFIRADALLAELGQARADRSYDKVFRRYLAPDLVILDDFGLHRLTAQPKPPGCQLSGHNRLANC
jgi:IstB-like ATP binding protein